MGTFTIGQKIKTGRLSRNMTQADLAKALGVSPSAIGMWEQDRREPDFDTLEALADVFNVPMSYFVTEDGKRISRPPVLQYAEGLSQQISLRRFHAGLQPETALRPGRTC